MGGASGAPVDYAGALGGGLGDAGRRRCRAPPWVPRVRPPDGGVGTAVNSTRHETRELVIKTKDGRQATVRFSQEAMHDPWKQLSGIEAAFKYLARRARPGE